MTRYTHADFADDDSVNSVQLTEGVYLYRVSTDQIDR